MQDTLKALLEEPEKLRKLILVILRNIIITIFATTLYKWLFGDYYIIDFLNLSQWIEFVMSGRILTTVFCYVLSHITLFGVLTSSIELLIIKFKPGVPKLEIDDEEEFKGLFKALSFLGILSTIDDKIKFGKHTNTFINVLESIHKDDFKKEIYNLKNSFLNDIIHIFFASSVVYYSSVHVESKSIWVHIILSLAGVLMLFSYVYLSSLVDYVYKNADVIVFRVKIFRYEDIIDTTMKEFGITIKENPNSKADGYQKSFSFKDEEFILEFIYGTIKVSSTYLDHYIELYKRTNKKLFLTSNNTLSETAQALLTPDTTFIVFTTQEELRKQLSEKFEEK